MLRLLRRRSTRCPIIPPCVRLVNTSPRPIAEYVNIWDPTQHSLMPVPPTQSQHETLQSLRRRERAELRHSQSAQVVVISMHDTIRRLNKVLRVTERYPHLRQRLRLQLWKAYTHARLRVPKLHSMMNNRACDLLWDSQRPVKGTVSVRRHRFKVHMYASRGYIPVGQRIEYLEDLFFHGKEEEAVKEWEKDHNETNKLSRHDYKPEHLELGARMYALTGHADRAREVMEELFELYPSWNPSIMLAVFRAHTTTASAQHHDLAKAIYLSFKQRRAHQLTLRDFDACFVGFLECQHLGYARMVFRDMVTEGLLVKNSTAEEVQSVLQRLQMLYRLGTDISKMTSIALQAISVLPSEYYHHIFSHWMKSAVVRDAPEAAVQILEMMFNRAHQPDTVHFNLLLKALLRTKDKPRILKAENIGWQMIEETRKSNDGKFTLPQSPFHGAPEIISWRMTAGKEMTPDSPIVRMVPKANSTTFALMMEHHASDLQWEHVEYLSRQFRDSNLAPNTALMNILMDNECRKGKYSAAWKIYKSLTTVPKGRPGVFPNGASIRCVWKILRLALSDHATRNDPELPTPRELLAETVQWWKRYRKRYDSEQFRVGLSSRDHGAIGSLMLHCFSYTQDLAGSLVTLHVLRRMFNIFPSNNAAVTLQKHAAWVDLHREPQSVRLQYSLSGINQRNIEKLGQVYYILLERRLKRMGITEDDYDKFTDEEIGDMGLNLLSEFVRVVMKRSCPPEVVEAKIKEVKKKVGVPKLPTGDLDAFNVA